MSEYVEWGPWVAHDGTGCPLPDGTFCEVRTRGGDVLRDTCRVVPPPGHISLWTWAMIPEEFAFLAITDYRVRKPRALRDLIALAADPYAPPPVVGPQGPARLPDEVA